jgi:hypothetical protein
MTPYRIRGITIKDRNLPLNELIASISDSCTRPFRDLVLATFRAAPRAVSSSFISEPRWQSTVQGAGPKGTVRIRSCESVRRSLPVARRKCQPRR